MKYFKFAVIASFFLALATFVCAQEQENETVSGKLKVVMDEQGAVKSASILDEDGAVSYNIVITKDSAKQLSALNGKMVEVTGKIAEKSEDEPLLITVISIKEVAPAAAAPADAGM